MCGLYIANTTHDALYFTHNIGFIYLKHVEIKLNHESLTMRCCQVNTNLVGEDASLQTHGLNGRRNKHQTMLLLPNLLPANMTASLGYAGEINWHQIIHVYMCHWLLCQYHYICCAKPTTVRKKQYTCTCIRVVLCIADVLFVLLHIHVDSWKQLRTSINLKYLWTY